MYRYFILILIITWIVTTSKTFAQDSDKEAGTVSALFLRADILPRPSALSGAYTALSNDEAALYYNPAGLAELYKGMISLNHMQWFMDIKFDNFTASYKLGKNIGIGAGISHMWMPAIEGRDINGLPTESQNVSSSIVSLGFAYRFLKGAEGGIGVKYFNDNLTGSMGTGFAADLGFLFHTYVRGLRIGFSMQNISGKITYNTLKENIPRTTRAGIAYQIERTGLVISGEAFKSFDHDLRFAFGIEYKHPEWFAVRVGNQIKHGQAFSPTFGVGFFLKNSYFLDYSFYNHENLGLTHRFGFSYHFLLPGEKETESSYSPGFVPSLVPPGDVNVEIKNDKLVISWTKVPGAKYNVYARAKSTIEWKKLNARPLYSNQMEFNHPKTKTTLYFKITSIIDDKESHYSKEVNIDIH